MSRHNAKILHLDIETAPTSCYSWSLWPKFISPSDIQEPGYTLCWAAQWDGERSMHFAKYDPKDMGKQMLQKVWDLLDEADMVVHYNGTKFDIPVLFKEFAVNGMPPPSHFYEIDLIKTVRKRFRFESNKLDYVCQRLGLGAKTQHKGMSLWYGCMEGEASSWRTMEKYNRQDVRLLKKLYKMLLPWIPNHPNLGMWVEHKNGKLVCPHCASTNLTKKGTQFNTKSQSYDRYKCNTCDTPLRDVHNNGNAPKLKTTRTP
jgi:hypothetical protein